MMSRRKYGRARAALLSVAGLLVCGAAALVLWQALSGRAQRRRYERLLDADAAAVEIDAETELRIKAFCGDCHAVPLPESFDRGTWYDEVHKGYRFYAKSGRTDLDPPPIHLTVAYFRSRAPEQLVYPEPKEAETRFRASFAVERVDLDPNEKALAATAGLQWTRLHADDPPLLVASDMGSGDVTALDLGDRQRRVRRLARLNNPCHVEPCDLDGDGRLDLLAADLGSLAALDHDRGRVVWLRQNERKEFEEVVLASGLGRVADARPIDVDSDGDLDVIVAEFGWYRTGRILLLRNVAPRGQRPRFEPEELDPRTGTIHVPVYDFDGDGRPDFAALISNESESVELFLAQGNGKFHRRTLWTAPDLTFGSSGIWPADMDGDGDMDIVYANGDAFDNMYLSPWHGVGWLENLGRMEFKYHRLTDMPGASIALPGDFDGDGDLDILVTAFLPRGLKPDAIAAKKWPSVVLLEQASPGRFVRHTLETGLPCHAAAAVGDFDNDGDLDFAVGAHGLGPGRAGFTVWWNQRIASGK